MSELPNLQFSVGDRVKRLRGGDSMIVISAEKHKFMDEEYILLDPSDGSRHRAFGCSSEKFQLYMSAKHVFSTTFG